MIATVSENSWKIGQKVEIKFSVINGCVLSDVDRPLTVTTSSSTVQGTQTVCAIMGMGQNCKVFPDVLKVKYMLGILFAVANDTTST